MLLKSIKKMKLNYFIINIIMLIILLKNMTNV